MVEKNERIRYAVGIGLLGGAVAGTAANLLGFETISPAYFAGAFAAGAATLPEAERSVCGLRERLPV